MRKFTACMHALHVQQQIKNKQQHPHKTSHKDQQTQQKKQTNKHSRKAKEGKGPVRRARTFKSTEVIRSFQLGMFPVTPMRMPRHQLFIGSKLLFRTEEMGCMTCSDVTLSCLDLTVAFRVSMSKTDPEASGATMR